MPSNGPAPDGPRPPASPPKDMAELIARYKGGDLIAAVALVECLCAKLQDARDEIERLKRAAPGPATEEMLELCRDTIDRQWLNAPSLDLCRKFLAERGRPVPAEDPLASMRADLKVKKTPDIDE